METPMQFTVSLEPLSRVVRCTVSGTIHEPGLRAMAPEVLGMARAHNCHSILLDVTAANARDSVTEAFQVVTHLDGFGLLRSDFVAVVYSKDIPYYTFSENVAHNRGWNNVRYFADPSAAEAWLHKMSSTPVA